MKSGICGAKLTAAASIPSLICELEAGHTGWHQDHGAKWNNGDEVPPDRLAPEEREVIEAAKALCACWKGTDWTISLASWRPIVERIRRAVDALPKPEPSLTERLRNQASIDVELENIDALLREAADELERLGAK